MKQTVDRLDAKGYRKFGLTTGAIVIVLFGVLIPWLFGLAFPRWPWILGGVLAAWALIAPSTLQPVYTGWMKFGHVMNWINTRIILGILFYGLFLPIGALMRVFGKDPMRRRRDKTQSSYRIPSQNDSIDNVERPY
jgi:hypothetical protein